MSDIPYSRVITELPILRNFSRMDRIWVPIKRVGEHITRRISLRDIFEGAQKMIKDKYTIRISIKGEGSYKFAYGDSVPTSASDPLWNNYVPITKEDFIVDLPEGTKISLLGIPNDNSINPFWTLRGGFALSNPVVNLMVTSDNTITLFSLPIKTRTFTDPVYQTTLTAVTIGTQEWTTTPITVSDAVYTNLIANNLVNGIDASRIAGRYLTEGNTENWRVPNLNDFNRLSNFVGGLINGGRNLKTTSGWKQKDGSTTGIQGLNVFGMNVAPTGWGDEQGALQNQNNIAAMWTTSMPSDAADINDRIVVELNGDSHNIVRVGFGNHEFASIRLVRDITET